MQRLLMDCVASCPPARGLQRTGGRSHARNLSDIRVTALIPGGMRTRFVDRFEEQGIPMPDPEGLQDPAAVAETILFAVRMPAQPVIQELLVTPLDEPSWP